jgi:hypothetical protein
VKPGKSRIDRGLCPPCAPWPTALRFMWEPTARPHFEPVKKSVRIKHTNTQTHKHTNTQYTNIYTLTYYWILNSFSPFSPFSPFSGS